MLSIISQQTVSVGDVGMDVFTLEVDAATGQLAKLRARRWARTEFPLSRPQKITLLGAENQGVSQTKLSDFIPTTFQRNEFRVKVAIKE